jgi:hypothetical protein
MDARNDVTSMSVFDEIDRVNLTDERDQARRDLRHLRTALRRIASGPHALTAEERKYSSIAVLSNDALDPAKVIALCALAITDDYADDGEEVAGSEDHRVEPCPTIELELDGRVERIDASIAPLVQALNRLGGLRTLFSCEGHPSSNFERRASVALEYGGVRIEILVEPNKISALSELVSALPTQSKR